MAGDEAGTSTDMAALESFVAENDELLELEERIGRFNVFDALGIVRAEIRHSNFLAWLLDPSGSHGQGDLFLKAVLMDVLRTARESGMTPPVSLIELDGADLHRAKVFREQDHIDLLIDNPEPRLVVAVENKVESGEREGQLKKYRRIVADRFPNVPSLYVFLTPDGDDASENDWLPYSYGDIHRVLSRVRRGGGGSLGGDVVVVLDHYLNLIGSRFMQDPRLDELCKRIYTNHRRAIQMIWERAGAPTSGVLAAFESALASESGWHTLHRTDKRLDFVPAAWLDWIPRISAMQKMDPRFWVRLFLVREPKGYRLFFQIGPTTDIETRRRLIARLTRDSKEFGLRVSGKATDKWTKLWSATVIEFEEEEDEPEEKVVVEHAMEKLREFARKTMGVPDAAREALSDG